MDIKERLRLEIAAGARGEWVADHCFKRLLDDALAEIELRRAELADLQARYQIAVETLARINALREGETSDG